jgi:hypothetical protein
MVVERTRPFVKTSSVPRVPKSETMEVQMMAELVTQRTQKSSEGSDLLPNGCFRPDSDQHRRRVIVAEELRRRIFPNAKRSSGKNSDWARRDVVKIGRSPEERRTGNANISGRTIFHRRFDGSGKSYELPASRQFQCFGSIADSERFAILFPWWSVRQHPYLLCRKRPIRANKRP